MPADGLLRLGLALIAGFLSYKLRNPQSPGFAGFAATFFGPIAGQLRADFAALTNRMTTMATLRTTARRPFRATDLDGKAIMMVPLAQAGQFAKLFPADFEELVAAGLSTNWTWNPSGRGRGYVRVAVPGVTGNLETVVRLIMKPGAGHCVGYHDGDRRNLRRDNLFVTAGRAKGREGGAFVADLEEAEGDAGAATSEALAAVLASIGAGGGRGNSSAIRGHTPSTA